MFSVALRLKQSEGSGEEQTVKSIHEDTLATTTALLIETVSIKKKKIYNSLEYHIFKFNSCKCTASFFK